MNFIKTIHFAILFSVGTGVAAQSVYTTKTGEKYHKGTCHYLKNSKKEITLEKALELGYEACSVCKPSSGSDSKKVSNLLNSDNTKKSTSTQCTGKTQAGARCKRMTKSANGKCYQH